MELKPPGYKISDGLTLDWPGAMAGEAPRNEEPSDVVSWVREKLGFVPDATQEMVLNPDRPRGIVNCTRQWGKSTIAAAKAVHQAATVGGSLTLAASPSARQSGEFLRKAEEFTKRLGIRVKSDGENEMSIEFPSGSRIIGLPGNEATIRGFSAVALLLVDEASRVSDELYLALRPMMAVSQGSLWLMSTPFGKRGFFHEAWVRGGPEWVRVRVPAEECARIPKAFLEEERGAMGDRWFRQEYQCEFVDSVSSVFDMDLVERAFTDQVKPLVFR